MRLPRLRLVTVLIALLALTSVLAMTASTPTAPRTAPRPAGASPSARTRLVVVLVADGLSWEHLWNWRAWWTSGFRRLLEEGRVERESRYRHLVTETGPGHASLSTGAPPRVHGIVANDWSRPGADGKLHDVYCASQPPAAGEETAGSVPGPGRLAVPTLGDALLAAGPGARVVSIAGKDRSAIFLAGKDSRHAAFWYSKKSGTFETTPAYDPSAPAGKAARAVIDRINAGLGPEGLRKRFGTVWNRLPVPDPRPSPGPEDVPITAQSALIGADFPHDLSESPQPLIDALRFSPFADELLGDAAVALLEDDALALGRRGATDMLAVGFSAHDAVAHLYGAESEEALEALRRLDLQIGRLLEEIERRFPKGSVVLALSSDHGFAPLPEMTKRRNPSASAGRVDLRDLTGKLNERLRTLLCLDHRATPVAVVDDGGIHYDPAAYPLARVGTSCGPPGATVDRAGVDEVIRRATLGVARESVRNAFAVGSRASWPKDDPDHEFALNSVYPGRTADVLLVPSPGWFAAGFASTGSTHGSPHEYDIHVPLIFWGAGFSAALSDRPSSPYDLAPTLAARLEFVLPDATGRDLLAAPPAPKVSAGRTR